jgi:hypothetical protein
VRALLAGDKLFELLYAGNQTSYRFAPEYLLTLFVFLQNTFHCWHKFTPVGTASSQRLALPAVAGCGFNFWRGDCSNSRVHALLGRLTAPKDFFDCFLLTLIV